MATIFTTIQLMKFTSAHLMATQQSFLVADSPNTPSKVFVQVTEQAQLSG